MKSIHKTILGTLILFLITSCDNVLNKSILFKVTYNNLIL